MTQSKEKIVPTACCSHCGAMCVLKAHVKDGIITRFETDDGEEPQLRACARGRAYRQRVYDPNRLLHPLKRTGARGEGKFEKISWDEALDKVTGELKRVKDAYGPSATAFVWGGGDINQIHNSRHFHHLLCLNGGYTRLWGVPSFQAGIYAIQATYGIYRTANAREDLLNSRFILAWGVNPASTVLGSNTGWYLAQAREKGIKVVAVDPQYTNSVATLADQWIPIYPGTDSAMLIAMGYVIIKNNLYDKSFLDKYTVGFDMFKNYVLGNEDGEAKTPAWAEKITGVPAATIEALAKEYATNKPAALLCGIAPGRTAYGEQYHRAASLLAAMTGNVGIHGGDAAGRTYEGASWFPYKMGYGMVFRPEDGKNPMEVFSSDGRMSVYVASGVHYATLPEAIMKGKAGGFPDIKLAFIQNKNYVNQYPNINKIVEALQKLEFIVALEQVMTPTARYADIILPTSTFLERNDIDLGLGTPAYGYVNKAIEPLGESKSQLEIARALATRMGFKDLGDETEDELLRKEVARSEIPDYDKFKKEGVYKIKTPKPHIAFEKQIEDPAANPFSTPSGKIEIYAKGWAEKNDPKVPPVPQYVETWESRNDPLAKKYPLQMITSHFKRRTHGQYENVPWLRELEPQAVTLSTADAKARGIRDGDTVRVFNDRGTVAVRARVTERIMPGVVDLPQGAWYAPDKNGVDWGGNPNTLTKEQTSPGGGYAFNTCLVQVEKL